MPVKTVHCSICNKAVSGYDFFERMSKLRRHRKQAHPKTHRKSYKKRKLDPVPPDPIDIHGFDGSLVRLVPEVDQLIETVIVLPKHQFEEVKEKVKGWKDVEFEKGRIIRRAKKNKATNIFIDSE